MFKQKKLQDGKVIGQFSNKAGGISNGRVASEHRGAHRRPFKTKKRFANSKKVRDPDNPTALEKAT